MLYHINTSYIHKSYTYSTIYTHSMLSIALYILVSYDEIILGMRRCIRNVARSWLKQSPRFSTCKESGRRIERRGWLKLSPQVRFELQTQGKTP